MTIRADLRIELPALRATLSRTAGRCRVIQIGGTDAGEAAVTFRLSEVTPTDIVGTLEHDDTVRSVRRFQGEKLVQVRVPRESLTYDALIERGGVIEQALATHRHWRLTVLFPDHQRLQEYWSVCRDRGHSLRVGRLCGAEEPSEVLTTAQEDVLRLAHEYSYFSIPRGAELSELASHLEISDQAASERLRRGMDSLLTEYFGDREETTESRQRSSAR